MEIILGNTALAIGLIFGLAALGTGVGFGLLGGKFTPAHVQNATLAGGVAVGAIASLEIGFALAAAIGAFGGMVSTVRRSC